MAKKKSTKTLIEKSIEIYGMGHPEVKTVFNIETEQDRDHFRFRNLETICGRKLTAWFRYTEEGSDQEIESKLQMTIPANIDELAVKSFIVDEIKASLI